MALQVVHSVAQGGEEIFEYAGGEEESLISQEKIADRLLNYKELLRSKTDTDGCINNQTISPLEAFEVFQGKIFSTRTEYSLADTVEKRAETPMQRLVTLNIFESSCSL
jgi:hypothetical protein